MPLFGPQTPYPTQLPVAMISGAAQQNPALMTVAGAQSAAGSYMRSQQMAQMARMAAQRFASIGTDQGDVIARQLLQDPFAALQMADQYGGLGELESVLRSNAAGRVLSAQAPLSARYRAASIYDPATATAGVLAEQRMQEMATPKLPSGTWQADSIAAYMQTGDPGVLVREYTSGQRIYDPSSPTGYSYVGGAASGRPAPPPGSTTVSVDKDGNVTFTQGAQTQAIENTKPTQNLLQKDLYEYGQSYDRLSAVESSYQHEYLTLGSQAEQAFNKIKEKAGVELTQPEREALGRYTDFRSGAVEHMSLILNQLSGAAVSPQEFERLRKFLPDPENDSPTEFLFKMSRAKRSIAAAIARAHYTLKHGVSRESIGIGSEYSPNSIHGHMRQVARKAFEQARQMGRSKEEAGQAADAAVRAEFGMGLRDVLAPGTK